MNEYLKLILKYYLQMNEVVSPFEDSEYLDQINIQYFKILSNVTERGLQKLYPSELMYVRLGRSRFNHFIQFHSYFALSMNMMHHFLFHKVHDSRV